MKPSMVTCQGARFLPYGLVVGHEVEAGYVSLAEIRDVQGPWGLHVERDVWWTPKPLCQVPEYAQWSAADRTLVDKYHGEKTVAEVNSDEPEIKSTPAEVNPDKPEVDGWQVLTSLKWEKGRPVAPGGIIEVYNGDVHRLILWEDGFWCMTCSSKECGGAAAVMALTPTKKKRQASNT